MPQDRSGPPPGTDRRSRWSWLVPAAGALWAAWHLRRSYFFYDEWSMIDRVLHSSAVDGTIKSFNGHLWMLQYWVYHAQVFRFGVDDHRFVIVVFLGALVTLHLSLATLFRASGLSRTPSMVVGGLLTYLGVASQNFLFAIQISTTLSMAAGVAASAIVLAADPSMVRAVAAGTLLLLAVAIDSGTALIALTLAACVTLLSWRGLARFVVLPAILALGLWVALGNRGPAFPADLDTRAHFARQLLLLSAGGLFGQIGATGEVTGAIVLAGSIALIGFGIRRRIVDRRGRIMFIAGAAATLVATAALAQARAGVPR